MKSLLCILVVVFFCMSSSFALTPKEQKGVKTLKASSLEYTSPNWFTPFELADAPEEITYRKSLLPEQDRYEKTYIVMPTLGLVAPVVQISAWSVDFQTMQAGEEIDINKYLINGVLHYPWSASPNEEGNVVIFGHSNFYKNRGVRYPSIFADIMNLDTIPTDELWLFVLEWAETYELYKYRVEASYETVPTDVGILEPQWGKELTVFACTNGLAGRWILRAKQLPDGEVLVPSSTKVRVWTLLGRLNKLPEATQQDILSKVLSAIENVRTKPAPFATKRKKQMRAYLLRRLESMLIAPPTFVG